jgi:thymidine phosphorylase
LAVLSLGGGRRRPQDSVDPAVGLSRLLPIGAQVRAGDTLALTHARTESDAEAAMAAVRAAYTIGPSKPPADKAVMRRVVPRS